jgi:predicted acetyltransferase
MVSLQQTAFIPERQLYEFDILNDAVVVGFAQLRLKGSKAPGMPKGFESHVYYEIKPDYRGRGYATAALAQLLKFAASRGLKTIIATVSNDNTPSIKVIEANGGQLLVKASTASGELVLKYQIPT